MTEGNHEEFKLRSIVHAPCDQRGEERKNKLGQRKTSSKKRLASTSSSTSSQSIPNGCQFVSVVITNEQPSSTYRDTSITCHTNLSNHSAHDNDILDPSNLKEENVTELTHNDSNDKDIPSDVKNNKGNHDHVDTVKDNNKGEIESECDNVPMNITEDVEGRENIDKNDSVAFTDESCTQYIDSEDSDN